jgi:hypothetical protein
VDDSGNVASYISLTLDNNDSPMITYCNPNDGTVNLARLEDDTWTASPIDSGASYAPLAVDSANNPHIVYIADTILKYAKSTGTDWEIETVDMGDWGYVVSFALDSNDLPHIGYLDAIMRILKYAHWTGDDWEIQMVDMIFDLGLWVSLGVDSNNLPHMAYYDNDRHTVVYADKTTGAWNIQDAEDSQDAGRYFSLIIDENDIPHISYSTLTAGDMMLASKIDQQWTSQLVEPANGGWVGLISSLKVDQAGEFHIVYDDFNSDAIKYSRSANGVWEHWLVVTGGGLNYAGGFDLDSQDFPHIGYLDDSSGLPVLTYTRW